MNSTVYHLSTTLFLVAFSLGLPAQELITPLNGNPQSAEVYRQSRTTFKNTLTDTIDLPFFDDFSDYNVKPDPDLWADFHAFINNHFPVNPVSNGVATLDAVDADGSIYPHATIDPKTFVSDYLSSLPLRMKYEPSDSIYFSFFYQAQGLGDDPEEQDSLLVDFYSPADTAWINVWGTAGMPLEAFRQVMIPVSDSRFLQNGFRFRFRNRASLTASSDYEDMRGNVDQWHLDYVRLDRNRFAGDTILRDVAFTTPISSVLKDYSAVPWTHFENAYETILDYSVAVGYSNNDTVRRILTRSLSIEEPMWGEIQEDPNPTAQDLPAREDTVVEFNLFYPLDFDRGDSAVVRFKAALKTDEFDPKVNDTVVHEQIFSDYFAYDDGTPEVGYGLRGQGTANGTVAVRFSSFIPDELGGVDIYFNQVYDSINLEYYFKFMVWEDRDGFPGTPILDSDEDHTPGYSQIFPGFVRYYFADPVPVDGDFYVGWRQYRDKFLHVGLDKNNRPSPHVMFVNFTGSWTASGAPGVILIRPFLYDETMGSRQAIRQAERLELYPNPARDVVHLRMPPDQTGTEMQVKFFDNAGRLIQHRQVYNNMLDVSLLPPGLYHLAITSENRAFHAKLMVKH